MSWPSLRIQPSEITQLIVVTSWVHSHPLITLVREVAIESSKWYIFEFDNILRTLEIQTRCQKGCPSGFDALRAAMCVLIKLAKQRVARCNELS